MCRPKSHVSSHMLSWGPIVQSSHGSHPLLHCVRLSVSYSAPGWLKFQTISGTFASANRCSGACVSCLSSVSMVFGPLLHIQRLFVCFAARRRLNTHALLVMLRFTSDSLCTKPCLISRTAPPPACHYLCPVCKEYCFATS